MTLVKGALLAGALLALAPGAALAGDVPDRGTTPYVTHFIFRPLQSIEIPELGSATVLCAESQVASQQTSHSLTFASLQLVEMSKGLIDATLDSVALADEPQINISTGTLK